MQDKLPDKTGRYIVAVKPYQKSDLVSVRQCVFEIGRGFHETSVICWTKLPNPPSALERKNSNGLDDNSININ